MTLSVKQRSHTLRHRSSRTNPRTQSSALIHEIKDENSPYPPARVAHPQKDTRQCNRAIRMVTARFPEERGRRAQNRENAPIVLALTITNAGQTNPSSASSLSIPAATFHPINEPGLPLHLLQNRLHSPHPRSPSTAGTPNAARIPSVATCASNASGSIRRGCLRCGHTMRWCSSRIGYPRGGWFH